MRLPNVRGRDTTDEPAELDDEVPEQLRPYFNQTTGLPRRERQRIQADGGLVTVHPVHPARMPGPRDELRPPETITVDEYEFQVRLQQAEALRRDHAHQQVMPPAWSSATCAAPGRLVAAPAP